MPCAHSEVRRSLNSDFVRLSTYITADDVREMAPDAVIVATGSLPRLDGRQHLLPGFVSVGVERPQVISSHELLMDRSNRNWGRHAVVFDDVGHYEGVAAAEFLAMNGVAVTFATSLSSFAPKLEASLSSEPALQRLAKKDFRLITYAKLVGVNERTASIARRFGGAPEDVEADTVVLVSHNSSNRALLEELSDYGKPVIGVGDARSPRFLQTAIREGHLAARSL